MSRAISLVTVDQDVLLTIAEAQGMVKRGHYEKAFSLMENRLKLLAQMLTAPEEAAIGDLIAMIADANGISESDAYLWLQKVTAGEVETEAGE